MQNLSLTSNLEQTALFNVQPDLYLFKRKRQKSRTQNAYQGHCERKDHTHTYPYVLQYR